MHKHTTTHSSTESEFPDDRGLLLLISNGEGCCRYRATQCQGFDGSASGWPGKLLRILIASEHWCECVSMRDTVERRQGEQMNCGILVWECNGIHVRQIFLSFFLVHASVYVCVPPQMFMHLCIPTQLSASAGVFLSCAHCKQPAVHHPGLPASYQSTWC